MWDGGDRVTCGIPSLHSPSLWWLELLQFSVHLPFWRRLEMRRTSPWPEECPRQRSSSRAQWQPLGPSRVPEETIKTGATSTLRYLQISHLYRSIWLLLSAMKLHKILQHVPGYACSGAPYPGLGFSQLEMQVNSFAWPLDSVTTYFSGMQWPEILALFPKAVQGQELPRKPVKLQTSRANPELAESAVVGGALTSIVYKVPSWFLWLSNLASLGNP